MPYGFAHQQGRAAGKNKTYIGKSDYRLPDGKGKLITQYGGPKETKVGYWHQDTYLG